MSRLTTNLSAVALTLVSVLSAADRKVIHPKEFPKGRPFSPGILSGDTLYVAGQTGNDLATGKIPEEFEAEVKQTLNNIGIILTEAKMSFDDVTAVQVYLTDMELFPRMNAVYTTFFKEPRPTRTTVGVAKLVGTARIEITVTARK
jgi:2-iminobutanoate/2-iminopropanoate deaminase